MTASSWQRKGSSGVCLELNEDCSDLAETGGFEAYLCSLGSLFPFRLIKCRFLNKTGDTSFFELDHWHRQVGIIIAAFCLT